MPERSIDTGVQMPAQWFRRLADVPQLADAYQQYRHAYPKSEIPGHGMVPREVTFETAEGVRQQNLTWRLIDGAGSTSASPAKQHASPAMLDQAEPPQATLQRLNEALELPGEPRDYHFIIQGAIERLSQRSVRLAEPGLLKAIEQLCWLNIHLIDALPEIITYERDGQPGFFAVHAFRRLIDIYQREGFLHEALAVAERELSFGGSEAQVEKLRQRIAIVDGEDAV